MTRAASPKSTRRPQPHHRPRGARARILAAADGWARLDGWPDTADRSDAGADVIEKFLDHAFDLEDGLAYSEQRALLETLIDLAPRKLIAVMLESADSELAALADVEAEHARIAKVAAAVGCSLDVAESIVRRHDVRAAAAEVA